LSTIDDPTPILVEGLAPATADHLREQRVTASWPGEENGVDLWDVDALGEHRHVDERAESALSKPFDRIVLCRSPHAAVDDRSGNAMPAQQLGQGDGVLDIAGEDQTAMVQPIASATEQFLDDELIARRIDSEIAQGRWRIVLLEDLGTPRGLGGDLAELRPSQHRPFECGG